MVVRFKFDCSKSGKVGILIIILDAFPTFKKHFNITNPVAANLSEDSYTAYIIHPIIIVSNQGRIDPGLTDH